MLHHSEYMLRLIRDGRLQLRRGAQTFTYHDPCELGRGSRIYDQPREVIEAVGVLLEPAQTREHALCCGSSVANTAISDAQQLRLARSVAKELSATGAGTIVKMCIRDRGTVWEWIYENDEEIYGQFSAAYNRPGAGALRKLDDRSMEELHRIFDVTGGKEFFDTIEKHSDRKAREMGYDGADDEYMMDTYTKNSNEHY